MSNEDGPWVHDFQGICKKSHKRNFVWEDNQEILMTKVSGVCVYCDMVQEFAVRKYWQKPTRKKYFKIR